MTDICDVSIKEHEYLCRQRPYISASGAFNKSAFVCLEVVFVSR